VSDYLTILAVDLRMSTNMSSKPSIRVRVHDLVVGVSDSIELVTFRLRFDSLGHLQATLSKLLAYCLLRSTQPPTLSVSGNEK